MSETAKTIRRWTAGCVAELSHPWLKWMTCSALDFLPKPMLIDFSMGLQMYILVKFVLLSYQIICLKMHFCKLLSISLDFNITRIKVYRGYIVICFRADRDVTRMNVNITKCYIDQNKIRPFEDSCFWLSNILFYSYDGRIEMQDVITYLGIIKRQGSEY